MIAEGGHRGLQKMVMEGGRGVVTEGCRVVMEGPRGWLQRRVSEDGHGGSQRVVGKNQGFKLISNLHSSNVIGCGGELNQSGNSMEGCGEWS